MKNFELFSLSNNEYKYILICLSYESVANYIDDIENTINDFSKEGILLIDQLLITGNIENRFIACSYSSGELKLSTAKNVMPNNKIKEISANFFKKNPELIENSILPKYQRFLIKKGCVI